MVNIGIVGANWKDIDAIMMILIVTIMLMMLVGMMSVLITVATTSLLNKDQNVKGLRIVSQV